MPTYSQEILHLAEIAPTPIEPAWPKAEMANTLCGDRIEVALDFDGKIIRALGWQVHGCAILKASAAYLARQIAGKTTSEAAALIAKFSRSFENENEFRSGPLAAVYKIPARYKCALLAWHACEDLLRNGLR